MRSRLDGQKHRPLRGWKCAGACNNVTISGTVERSLMVWAQVIHVDSRGTVGRSLTSFSQTLGIDGKVGRDYLSAINQHASLEASVGTSMKKSETLMIEDSAQVSGTIKYEGNKEPVVSKKAKLASEVQFIHHVRHREEFGKSSVVWALLLAAAFVLFGLVLFLVMSSFSQEAVHAGRKLRRFVGTRCPSAVCRTDRLSDCMRYVCWAIHRVFELCGLDHRFIRSADGRRRGDRSVILGKAADTWGRIGRMAIGVLIIRARSRYCRTVAGLKLIVLLWGIGAISLALYRRFQPAAPPAQAPYAPPSAPLTPLTPAGGAAAI